MIHATPGNYIAAAASKKRQVKAAKRALQPKRNGAFIKASTSYDSIQAYTICTSLRDRKRTRSYQEHKFCSVYIFLSFFLFCFLFL